jgi:cytochrome c556
MKAPAAGRPCLVVGLAATLSVAAAQGERKLSINAVMHKQSTVSKAPFVVVKKELAGATPDWDKVRNATKSFAALAVALQKNGPPSGEEASWKRFTDEHLTTAKAFDEAAQTRDKDAVMSIHRKLAAACKACHTAHRVRGGGVGP